MSQFNRKNRRTSYLFLILSLIAMLSPAAGPLSGSKRTIDVEKPGNFFSNHWKLDCGMIAASIPRVLKDYRLANVGEEYVEVGGWMLVHRFARERLEVSEHAIEIEKEKIVSRFHDRRPASARDVVLHPEVCDNLVQVEEVTDYRACEFMFYIDACGLTEEARLSAVRLLGTN